MLCELLPGAKNLDVQSIPGEDSDSARNINQNFTPEYMNLDLKSLDDLRAVQDNEFAKVAIQFAESKDKNTKKKKKDCFRIYKCIEKAGRGNVLWILGLDGLEHLFEEIDALDDSDLEEAQYPKFYGDVSGDVLKHLNVLLSNSRDFFNRIPCVQRLDFTPSQSSREGFRVLLNTCLPFKTSDYFALHDPAYAVEYDQHSKRIFKALEKNSLSASQKLLKFNVTPKKNKKRPHSEAAIGQAKATAKPTAKPTSKSISKPTVKATAKIGLKINLLKKK